MATQLSAVLDDVRSRHPAFDKTRVPNAVLAKALGQYQNVLIGKAVARDKTYLSQTLSIALAIDSHNTSGVAGVNTTGGLPGTVSNNTLARDESPGGALVDPLTGAPIVVPERIVTAATATTVQSTGAGRTVNADANKLAVITGGTGKGQVRKVISNTIDTWTVAAWTIVPDITSLVTIVTPTYAADKTIDVVTVLPAQTARSGYLVRLDASGTPYLDYTKPLTLWIDKGLSLPSILATIGGTINFTDGHQEDLHFTSFSRRFDPDDCLSVYRVGDTLRLTGTPQDWACVEAIQVLYSPIAPAFVGVADFFLLPDPAYACLVAYGVAIAMERVSAFDMGRGAPSATAARATARSLAGDVQRMAALAAQAEHDFLSTIRLSKRARVFTRRSAIY